MSHVFNVQNLDQRYYKLFKSHYLKKAAVDKFLEKTLYFTWKDFKGRKKSKSGSGNVFCDKWCIEK